MRLFFVFVLSTLVLFSSFVGVEQVFAQAPPPPCTPAQCEYDVDAERRVEELKSYIANNFWNDRVEPALQNMTRQLSIVAMQQMQIVGTFFDAKHQLETQRLLQELQAQAHKDYHPSTGLCSFGTSVRSLAASERNSDFARLVLNTHAMNRQMAQANTAAMDDTFAENSRIEQYRRLYCNPTDLNYSIEKGELNGDKLCQSQPDEAERRNKDIDFTRTLGAPLTLALDFQTDKNKATPDETDIIALANNLYGYELIDWPTEKDLQEGSTEGLGRVMKLRSVVAKRSVAQNSFNTIAGMKAQGSGDAQFLGAVMKELGVNDDADIRDLIGERPSYYAQMEILSKKIYQNPDFFTNLYDKPANVARKGVALQAIGLMQDRDIYNSQLRSEAMLSVMLELLLLPEEEAARK